MSASSRSPGMKTLTPFILLALLILLAVWQREQIFGPPAANVAAGAKAGPGEYLFCTWNVENLFDDKDDKRQSPDDEYDNWFSHNAADRELKYKRLTEALLKMNGGKGPDLIALIEVETIRAAELLRDSLNKNLPDGATPYGAVQMKEVAAGRHIAPAVLSRLPVKSSKGFNQYRILEVHVDAAGKELVLLAAHWTSHRTDEGAGGKRDRYAKIIYELCERKYQADRKADILVCGDFNDEPAAEPVAGGLHAVSDAAKVAARPDQLAFLNLMAGKDPQKYGTHYYNKPLIYDHICVSPGLLDQEGWSCDPASIHTVTDGMIRPGATRRQPWRFGNRKDNPNRGFSDHFPVTVKLKVDGQVP